MAGSAPAANQALPRTTADRPDDVRGPQIHFVYAVPADGVDRELDTNGAIARSVQLFLRWLELEAGGPTLRVDTAGGELDVTFVRLEQTDAQLAARGPFVRDGIEAELRQRSLLSSRRDRLYGVYYDGTSTFSCGGAGLPSLGPVTAMYLRGLPNGSTPCPITGIGAGLGYWEFAMLHDLVHALGFVQPCAPHYTLAGHTGDLAYDLMWAGEGGWQLPPTLDPGRDDYYGHGRSDCADLARSEYLTSNPPPPPALVVGGFLSESPRPGRTFGVSAALTVDGAPPATALVQCTLRLRGKLLRVTATRYAGGRASCRWRLPAFAKGQRLSGKIRGIAGELSAERPFTVRVR